MATDPTQSLGGNLGLGNLAGEREAMQRDALASIRALASLAGNLALTDTSAALAENAEGLNEETFKMIVMGRFKNGKSTLINALMGGTTKPVDLGGAEGPMVVDDLPATAVLSEVNYADSPFIRAWTMDGQRREWTLAQYLRDSAIGDDDESRRRFAEIRQFEIGFPAKLCESKVVLYDSPGLDENPIRTRITMDAVHRCDTALMVFSTNALIGEGELKDDERVRNDGTHVFVVVNLFGDRQADDRLRGYVWNKYVRDHLQGPEWAGQDMADYDIYCVNAKLAAGSRYGLSGPAADQAYRDSGLAAFEQRLTRFLIDDRLIIHISNYVKKAVNLSDRILQHISQQQAAAAADRDRFRAAWAQQEQPLKELRTRPARLPRIIDRYRNEAIVDLTSGFTALVAGTRRDLPAYLSGVTLPTESSKTFAVWHQKKLIKESVEEINAFITRRITDWSENEADKTLRDIAGRLGAEINDEVADIGRRFDAMNMALTGWDSTKLGTPGSLYSRTERVTAAIAGLLFGDLSAAVGGGKGGWRGAAGGILGAGAATWLLVGVLGITGGIVFVPILAIAALTAAWMGSAGLVKRVKDKTLRDADEKLALLPPDIIAKITADLTARFDELETVITQEVREFIEEQVRGIEAQVQISQQAVADQERTLRSLKTTEQGVRGHRKALEDTLTRAKQV
jgi:Dynamin family